MTVKPDPGAKLASRILRDVLKQDGPFDELADLKDALSRRCRELHVRCEQAEIDRAFDLVGTNTPLIHSIRARVEGPTQATTPPILSQAEARAILADLGIRLNPSGTKAAPPDDRTGWPEHFPNLVRVPEW